MYKELVETAKKIAEIANKRSENMREGFFTYNDMVDFDEPYSDQITKILMHIQIVMEIMIMKRKRTNGGTDIVRKVEI